MAHLRKYGAAAQIDGIPLITKGAVDFEANPTLAAGDVTISKDGGAFASIEGAGTFGDFVAVAPASSTSVQVRPDATAMTCKTLVIRFIDQTTPKEWEDQEVLIETYGHASAMHPFDLGTALAAPDNTSIAGIKTQTDKLGFTGSGPYAVNAFLLGSAYAPVGVCDAGCTATTLLSSSAALTGLADQKDHVVLMLSGATVGAYGFIESSSVTGGVITVVLKGTGLPGAPAAADGFVVL
jgi:hypothetical protein